MARNEPLAATFRIPGTGTLVGIGVVGGVAILIAFTTIGFQSIKAASANPENNGYAFKSGSSMSAPVVTGVAALLLSYFPSLTAVQLKNALMTSVYKPDQMVNKSQTKIPAPFASLSVSGGIINVYNAVGSCIAK